jgi:hypothetical protein
MRKKFRGKRRKKWDPVNPENRRFGEITLSGFVYDVYSNGRYITSFIAPLYPTYFPYIISLGREIESYPAHENIQDIIKKEINNYIKSKEFAQVFDKSLRGTTDSKNDPPEEETPLSKVFRTYFEEKEEALERRLREYEMKLDEMNKKLDNLTYLLSTLSQLPTYKQSSSALPPPQQTPSEERKIKKIFKNEKEFVDYLKGLR